MIAAYSARLRRRFPVFSALVLISTLYAACGNQAGTTASNQNTQPIKIGVSLSLTGNFAAAGGNMDERGYQLWLDYVNAHGGLLGRKVMLDIVDDAGSSDQVQVAYQKLITVDKVDLIFGASSTRLAKPASLIANRYGYTMIGGSAGGPSVFNRGLHNVFDVSLAVASNLVSFARYLLSLPVSKRPTTVAYATSDDPFSQPQIDVVRSMLEQGGMKTVSYQVYPQQTTDYNPFADTIVVSGAQVVICGTQLPDISAFVQRFKQLHYNPRVLVATAGPDQGSTFLHAIGGSASADGIIVPNGWYPQLKTPGNPEMVRAYVARYGGMPDEISTDVAEAYSAGQVLYQAITKIKSLDNVKLMAELHSGETFQSVQGPVKFDDTGQNSLAQAYLFQWQNGALLPVYPATVASAPPEFPKPNWP